MSNDENAAYKYGLETPIDVLGEKYSEMVLLVEPKDKAVFDNVGSAPCVSITLQFNGIDPKTKLPVFKVKGCEKNEEISRLLAQDLGDKYVVCQGCKDKKFDPQCRSTKEILAGCSSSNFNENNKQKQIKLI